MRVEVKGVHFENQGAHLMLLAVLARLRHAVPDTKVVLGVGPNSPAERVASLGALRKLRLRKRWLDVSELSYVWPGGLTRLLQKRGLVAEGQLDAVLDASGFAYGGDWTPWLMTYAADEVRRLASRGRPYLFLPQAFGPFPTGHAASDFGSALESAALICVRDSESERYLAELNPRLEGRLERFPDFTIGLRGDARAASKWGVDKRTVLFIPNRQMMGERNRDAGWRDGYFRFLVNLAGWVGRQGREVRLLNHEGRGDAALCARIAEEVGGAGVITEADPISVKGVIGAASAVVCSRYHGCVAALSQGVPCLGTSWSHKYQALFDEFGASECLLSGPDTGSAAHRLEAILADRDAISKKLVLRSAILQARVEEMWRRVERVLESRGGVGLQ